MVLYKDQTPQNKNTNLIVHLANNVLWYIYNKYIKLVQ